MLDFSTDTQNNVDYDFCNKCNRNCWVTGNIRVTEAGCPISCGCAQTATGDWGSRESCYKLQSAGYSGTCPKMNWSYNKSKRNVESDDHPLLLL